MFGETNDPQSVLTIFSAPFFTFGQSGMSEGPAHLRVEFENGSIIVLRIRLDPHEKTPINQLTPRVVVWLTDAYLRDTFANGKTSEIRRSAGLPSGFLHKNIRERTL